MTAATIVPTRLRNGAQIGLAALALSAFSVFGTPAETPAKP